MLTFLNSARLQEFDNSGRLLDGGKIYTYRLQTTTPKETYSDINGNTANTNPVILDSVGSASIYLNGSYTLWLFDKFDVQIGSPVDVLGGLNDYVLSAGPGVFADNIVISVNNYNSVRQLTAPYSWVFVQGRENQADGGEGLFYLDLASTSQDDDGITLEPNVAGRYIRYNVLNIDPRWFGLVYDAPDDQAIYLSAAQTAAVRYARPVEIDGVCYLNQNFTTLPNTDWHFTSNAEMNSTLSLTFTFVETSKQLFCSRHVWGNTIQPIYAAGTVPEILYSWFDADNVEGRWAKFLASSSLTSKYVLDESIDLDANIVIPNNSFLDFRNGTKINVLGSSRNVTIPQLIYPFPTSAIIFPGTSAIGSLNLPAVTPKFFGAVGNLSQGDYTPIYASFKTGNFSLDDRYYIGQQLTLPNDVRITGNTSQYPTNLSAISATDCLFIDGSATSTLSGTNNLYLKNVNVAFPSNARILIDGGIATYDECAFYGDKDFAGVLGTNQNFINCYIGSHISTAEVLDHNTYVNVIKESDPSKRFYSNRTSLKTVYLEEETNTTSYTRFLATSADGKIYGLYSPNILSAHVDTLSYNTLSTSASVTKIKFEWHVNGGTQYCRTYRNDNVIADVAGTGTVFYDIAADDERQIEISVEVMTGAAYGMYIRPANRPKDNDNIVIINKSPAYLVNVGDNGTSYCWLPTTAIKLPDTSLTNGKIATIGFYASGKWAFS